MNPSDVEKQISLTQEELKKASQICAALRQNVDPALAKADVAASFFKNPQEAILEEQTIKEAPQHFIALAAYISQAVEGLQNALVVINAKVDALTEQFIQANAHVEKAIDSSLELAKAIDFSSHGTLFKSAPPATKEQLQAKIEDLQFKNATRGQILNALDRLAEENKISITEISYFESTGRVHEESIELVKQYLKQ